MNAPSLDIKDMLEAVSEFNSDGKFFIGVGTEPAKPSNTITIYDSGAYAPMLTYNKDEKYEYPSIQIRVRSVEYESGWAIIDHIKQLLHGRGNEMWNGALYTLVYCSSGAFQLDIDNNQRIRFVINFNLQRRGI
jgi:hypothetical protein